MAEQIRRSTIRFNNNIPSNKYVGVVYNKNPQHNYPHVKKCKSKPLKKNKCRLQNSSSSDSSSSSDKNCEIKFDPEEYFLMPCKDLKVSLQEIEDILKCMLKSICRMCKKDVLCNQETAKPCPKNNKLIEKLEAKNVILIEDIIKSIDSMSQELLFEVGKLIAIGSTNSQNKIADSIKYSKDEMLKQIADIALLSDYSIVQFVKDPENGLTSLILTETNRINSSVSNILRAETDSTTNAVGRLMMNKIDEFTDDILLLLRTNQKYVYELLCRVECKPKIPKNCKEDNKLTKSLLCKLKLLVQTKVLEVDKIIKRIIKKDCRPVSPKKNLHQRLPRMI